MTTAPLVAKTYVAYAVYEKTTDADVIVSIANGGMYPKYVAIKHVVKVDPINFTATAKEKAPMLGMVIQLLSIVRLLVLLTQRRLSVI